MKDEKIVLYESDEAATYRTNIEGWVSREGRFWGKDEHMARYTGCTHTKCECGAIVARSGPSKCPECRSKAIEEKYHNLPYQEWDGKTPVVTWDDDKFFYSPDEIEEHCEEHEIDFKDLKLVICEPNHFHEISPDYWSDVLPEDYEVEDIDNKLAEKVQELNEYIKTLKPASWSHGKYRTSFTPAPTGTENFV